MKLNALFFAFAAGTALAAPQHKKRATLQCLSQLQALI
jgi:Na+/H+-dicarboxylate symporter